MCAVKESVVQIKKKPQQTHMMGQLFVGALERNSKLCNIFDTQTWLLRLYVFLLLVTASTQQVQLLPFDKANTECDDGGVIDGRDQVLMTGFVTANEANPVFEFLKSRDGGANFFPDCNIDLDTNGCVSQSIAPCYCKDKSFSNYTVVYNTTANEEDSNAILALRYGVTQPVTQPMPEVHGMEQVIVTVNRVQFQISQSDLCDKISAGETYDFEICASNLAGVRFYIGPDPSSVNWGPDTSNCSNFVNVTSSNLGSMTFAYQETAGCKRVERINCTNLEPKDDDNLPLKLGLGLGLGLGIPALVVCIVVVMKITSTGCFSNRSETISQNGGKKEKNVRANSENRSSLGRPVSPPSLRYNEENKHTSEVETPREDEPRKKKKSRRGKTSPQGDDNRNDYTDAPPGTFKTVHKSGKNDNEKLEGFDHGDKQHELDSPPRRLPPLSKDGNRTVQSSGLNVLQSPQKSRPTSIEMTSGPRPLPHPLSTKNK